MNQQNEGFQTINNNNSFIREDSFTSTSTASSGNSSPKISTRKKWFYVIEYLVLGLLFVYGIRAGFFTLLNRNMFQSGATNTLCSQATPESVRAKLQRLGHLKIETDIVIKEPLKPFKDKDMKTLTEKHHICEYPSDFQFSKVIWFFTDGLPVKYSKKTFDHYREHMVLYPIDVPGPKYSHAIYTSYMTGQLPTNYQGKAIEGDSLVKSIQRSPDMGPLTYVGPEWSFLAIHGSKNYDTLFKRIHIREEPLDQPHDQAYRFFYKDDEAKKYYNDLLDTLKKEGGSLFAHSAIFDHINHGIFRSDPTNTNYLNYLSDRIAADLNTLKDWIDENPDYLLILSSDHGCDDVTNGYVLHGHSKNGNEGYVMLYNPKLKPYEQRLDIVDVCPTVAKYLKGVDIPADNIGVTRTFYGDDKEGLKYSTYILKENLVQLTDTTKRRGADLLRTLGSIYNLLAMEAEDASFSEKFNGVYEFSLELFKLATDFKQKLYQLLDKPVFWVIFYGAIALLLAVILLYRFYFHAIHLLSEKYFTKAIYLLLLLIPLYFGAYINVLFCWDTWKGVIRSGSPFFVSQGYLAIILFFALYQCALLFTEKKQDREAFSTIGWKLFIFLVIDMTFFMLYNLLRRQWKWGMDNMATIPFQYFTLIYFVCEFSGYNLFSNILGGLLFVVKKILRSPTTPSKGGNNNLFHFLCCVAMMIVLFLFEFTSVRETADQLEKAKYIHYYTIAGFHIYFLIFIIMLFVYSCFVILFNPKRLDRLVIPALLYAFALMRDTPHGRVVTLIQNIQYYYFMVPAFYLINNLCARVKRQDKGFNNSTNSPQFEEEETKLHYFDVLQLSIVMFFINHFMYGFHIGKEERLDVDAHPMAGAIGMKSHQQHPNFNAFQMGYEKWHMCLMFTLYFWSIVHKERGGPKVDKETKDADRYYITDIILSNYLLLLINAHVFLNLMLCFISMDHGFQETVVYLIVISVCGSLFSVFNMITRYSVYVIEWILGKLPTKSPLKRFIQSVFLSENANDQDVITKKSVQHIV
ncbi:hypothetical protein ABK040_011989 [Willaertia magna]